MITDVVTTLDGAFLWYFAALNGFYGLLLILSTWDVAKNVALIRRLRFDEQLGEDNYPYISLVIPAFNEERHIVDTVRAQLALDYPNYEIVVVNDGSTDSTLEVLAETFDLYEVPPAFPRRFETEEIHGYYRSARNDRLLVVDKENGGKADALNAGVDAARYPYCGTVDADTLIEKRALRRLVRPLLLGSDVVGAGGTIRVANDCVFDRGELVKPRVPGNWLAAIQVPEYLRAFLFGRLGWNYLGGNIILSGAFALFERDVIHEVGGFERSSVTEDLDVVVSLHRRLSEDDRDYDIVFVPDPVAWTEVPEDLGSLGDQRMRWHRGLTRSLLRNVGALFRPKYGMTGMIALPFHLFGEVLAPVIEALAYLVIGVGLATGVLSVPYLLLFLAVAYGWHALLSVASVCVEELSFKTYPGTRDFLKLLGYAALEPFGFRQLTVYWRLRGMLQLLVRGEAGWTTRRHGHNTVGRKAESGVT